jgi:hypothetical protein
MKVTIIIEIERGNKNLNNELDRLTRYIKSLDKHPDGLFAVHIMEFLI